MLEEISQSHSTNNAAPNGDDNEEEEEEEKVTTIPVCIHLRGTTVWTPGVTQPISAGLWRGRLSHVSAWSLGNLQLGRA